MKHFGLTFGILRRLWTMNDFPAPKRFKSVSSVLNKGDLIDLSSIDQSIKIENGSNLGKSIDILNDQSTCESDVESIQTASSSMSTSPIADLLLDLEKRLTLELNGLSFSPPVSTVYHPIDYAIEPHSDYVHRFCRTRKNVVFIGMNPGPFGMVQSGVPFGDCRIVKEWLGIRGLVRKPENEHCKRPIFGLDCQRSEVSGTRFWNFIRSLTLNDDPNSFFRHCYVHNYCPVAFMDNKGKNITPAAMKKADVAALESICDGYLLKAIDLLGPSIVIGIGTYAYERCRRALLASPETDKVGIRVEMIMHPSPANPATNTNGGWAVKVRKQLEDLGLISYMAT